MLLLGTSSTGLWDPWEMNHSAVASRMMQTPTVLVIDRQGADGDLSKALTKTADGRFTLENAKVAAEGTQGLDVLRDRTSDKIYAAVVLNLDTVMPADAGTGAASDAAAVKTLSNAVRNAAGKNLSTKFIIVSSSTGMNPDDIRSKILKTSAASGTEEVARLDGVLTAGSMAATPDLVASAASCSKWTAQFKASGRTMFQPPMDPKITSFWYSLFGFNEFSSRLTGIIFSILTILLVFFPGRRLFGEKLAATAILIMSTSVLFFGMARFAGAGMTEVFSLTLACLSFGYLTSEITGKNALLWWPVLALSIVLCWLSGGLVTVVTFAAIAGTRAIILPDRRVITVTGIIFAVLGLLAIATFIPDAAWFRQFRFTAATFTGGVTLESRSFDFIIKEIGFGFFPWSAFIPVAVWMAVTGANCKKPERLLLVLWAMVPMISAMIFIRPFNQTMYLGVPGLAILTALFFAESEDDTMQARIFGFFAIGLFLVIMKDITKSPAPLVTFLTTDPMFTKPGQGDGGFPASVMVPSIGKLFLGIMLLSMLSVASRISTQARRLPGLLADKKVFIIVVLIAAGLIATDIIIFTAIKWYAIFGQNGKPGNELLRIFVTGPDIILLYLMMASILVVRNWNAIYTRVSRLAGAPFMEKLDRAFTAFQTMNTQKYVFVSAAVGFAAVQIFMITPELTLHVSQKHIVDSWKESSEKAPGPLYRHGQFSTRGGEDTNFYTSSIEEKSARSEVTALLKDKSKRTFFIVPAKQFSEINSAYRDISGDRGLPVLDDRSSRIVLTASTLAAGETDHNWLAKATLTEKEFEALKDVERKIVNFDNTLELVGFQITPQAITRGTNPVLKTFYKVLKKVPKSYRVFLHVDKVGSSTRIHGDHWILNMVPESEDENDCVGCYATTHWKKGDIIVDTYELSVPIGSPSGDYDVWMGLYTPGGGGRLKVTSFDEDKIKHDGSERVRIGKMTVR